MNTANMLRLVALAAIWGGSFLFMRIAAPVLGPAVLIEYRLALAAVFLALVSWVLHLRGRGAPLNVRRHWQHYLILGLFNSALPFCCSRLRRARCRRRCWRCSTPPRRCGARSSAPCGRASTSRAAALSACCWAPPASRCWSALIMWPNGPARAWPWPRR
jgi:hypothetical protein